MFDHRTIVCAALVIGSAPLVLAHHSVSGVFDIEKTFKATGVVSRVDWTNPHTHIYVDVKQTDGMTVTYKLESHPVAFMRKSGVSKADLLGDGSPVSITAHPSRSDAHEGYLLYIRLGDGREIQFAKLPGQEQP